MPLSQTRLKTFFACLGFIALAAMLLPATGCASRFPSERIPQMKVLLLPFSQPPSMATDPRVIQGWWLGSSTIRQNPRAGIAIIDTFDRAMAALDYLHLYSPIEIKYYFADKTQMLKKAYPYLEDKEIKDLLAQVPQQDYARELGADKVLTGRIIRDYMGENRTFGWWWASLEAEVYIMDVGTGKKEWSQTYKIRRQFGSDARLAEELAQRVIKDTQEDYFLPMARK